MNNTTSVDDFIMDLGEVLDGLRLHPRRISSKYLYDAAGEALFRQIMDLEEYYLTAAEAEILQRDSARIIQQVDQEVLDIVELGAGDGSKTRYLLHAAQAVCKDLRYVPIDIAESAISALQSHLWPTLPDLALAPVVGDYLEGLRSLHASGNRPELILFLGSNIGNYTADETRELLASIRACVTANDRLLIGFDRKKDPRIIHRAYNDAKGVTKAFNLNLVERLRRELGASCHAGDFDHYESYDPVTGEARSYLVSEVDQTISFAETSETVTLRRGEVILTEISRKFDLEEIASVLEETGWRITDIFDTSDVGFTDVLAAPAV